MPLTAAAIKRYIPDPYFERGQRYYKNGAISGTLRRGDALQGDCEGSEAQPYRVRVTLAGDKIVGDDCSCPMGGGCKHVVALLLTYAHHPKHFVARAPLAEMLEGKSKAELLTLVNLMLQRAPELESLVDLPVPAKGKKHRPAVDPEVYRKQIRYALRDADDWYATGAIANAIASVVKIGDGFAAQEDWVNAARVYQAVLDEGLPGYEMTHDEGDISAELENAVVGVGQCLAAQLADSVARQGLLRALFEVVKWDTESGGLGMGDTAYTLLLEHTQTADIAEVRQWIQAALKRLPADDFSRKWHKDAWGRLLLKLDEKGGDVEGFIKRAKAQGLHGPLFTKLLNLKRFDEALALAKQHLCATPWERLQIADELEAAKRVADALALVEAGLPNCKDSRLFEWLAERYTKQKKYAEALALYQRSWQERPELELYDQMRQLAEKLKQWETLVPRLLAELEQKRDWDLLVEIHLREQNWDAAWAVARQAARGQPRFYGVYGDSLLLQVARATEKHYPAEAAEAYCDHAERLIEYQGRKNYQAAAGFLLAARKLYQKIGVANHFAQRLAALREKHNNKPALKEELAKAKL